MSLSLNTQARVQPGVQEAVGLQRSQGFGPSKLLLGGQVWGALGGDRIIERVLRKG